VATSSSFWIVILAQVKGREMVERGKRRGRKREEEMDIERDRDRER